jgi:hypothetical protein
MRRQTNTVNWSDDLPLAQNIRFGDPTWIRPESCGNCQGGVTSLLNG